MPWPGNACRRRPTVCVFAPWVAVGLVWGGSQDLSLMALRLALAGGAGLATLLAVGALTNRARRRRALARVPRPCHMLCADRVDHLILQSPDPPGPATTVLTADIRQVVPAPDHVFIDAAPVLVILPRAAFDDAAGMAGLAAHWQQALRDDEAKEDADAAAAAV